MDITLQLPILASQIKLHGGNISFSIKEVMNNDRQDKPSICLL
jgi:hypothetical protein